jgi:predicted nucleic acid-binding protein
VIYALDTNIISYLLRKDAQVEQKMALAIDSEQEFAMLPIVYYEVSRWLIERNATRLHREFEQMCADIPLVNASKAVWDTAARLYVHTRRIGKPVGADADLFIAAFCLVSGYTLVTNNTRHFENIDGLKLVNWKE